MLEMILATLICMLIPFVTLTILLYLLMIWKVERRLEEQHFECWRDLGSPHFIKNNTISNNGSFLKFLKNDGNGIDDEHLLKIIRRCWTLYKVSMVSFIALNFLIVYVFVWL